jgi:hypothetical protein
MIACERGAHDFVDVITCDERVDPTLTDNMGRSAAHYAVLSGSATLCATLAEKFEDIDWRIKYVCDLCPCGRSRSK